MCGISKLNSLIKRAIEIHGDKYYYSLATFKDYKTRTTFICKIHGPFEQTWEKHIGRKRGCKKCGYIKTGMLLTKNKNDLISDIRKVHGDKFPLDDIDYVKSSVKITLTCKIHDEFSITPNALLKGHGCPKCGIEKRSSATRHAKSFFIKRATKKHKGFYIYDLVDYINSNTKVKIICPLHGVFEQAPSNHVAGQCCPICATKRVGVEQRQTKEEFVEKSIKVHGYRNDYSLVDYQGNKIHVDIRCIKHNYIYKCRPDNHLKGSGCPLCNESKGENKVAEILDKYNLKHIREYVITGRYRYDFYLPDHNLLIEYDGQLHFIAVDFFGGQETLIKTKFRDKEKDELARKNKIKLLRIGYFNFHNIETIITKTLKLKRIE